MGILSVLGKLFSSAGKSYAKTTAKKREGEDKKVAAAKEQKDQKQA